MAALFAISRKIVIFVIMRIGKSILAMLLVLVLLSACGDHVGVRSDIQDRDSLLSVLRSVSRTEGNDSILSIVRPIFYSPPGVYQDELRLCAGVYGAQAFVMLEELDSLKVYLDKLMPEVENMAGTPLEGMLYTIAASYEMKAEWDFPAATDYLYRSYGVSIAAGDVETAIVPLVNMVNIYWMRSDERGMAFAELADSLANIYDVSLYHKCLSWISMAEMLVLAGKDEAEEYIAKASEVVRDETWSYLLPTLYVLYADMYDNRRDYSRADSAYVMAMRIGGEYELGMLAFICLHYGASCERQGRWHEAAALYEKGLDVSYHYGNNELVSELLLSLSDLQYRTGDSLSATRNYRRYMGYSGTNKERLLNNLRISYQEMTHDYEMQSKEVELLKAKRRVTLAIFLLVLLLVVTVFLIVTYRRRLATYRTLFEQYRNRLSEVSAPAVRQKAEDADAGLWSRLEHSMREDRIFRRHDLSMDMMAEAVGTNRAYVSKVINTFSGGDYYSYVNRYRVREAVRIIEECGDSVTFKQIADEVGFNSMPVFYKAFTKETGLPPGRYRDQSIRSRNRG